MSTDSPRELDFQIWRQWILAAAPTSTTEHHWICYTYNEKKQRLISVLTPEEYRDLSSKNSFRWGMKCVKNSAHRNHFYDTAFSKPKS